MDAKLVGLVLIMGGVAAVIIGWMILSGWFSWFGRLPGDLRLVSGGTRIYIPFTSMLVVSLVLTVIVNVIRRLS
jgi:hypothetical protein